MRAVGKGTLGFGMALLLMACERPAPPPPDVVALIGETEVRYAEFEDYLSTAVGETSGTLGGAVLSGLFDQFLDERLLARLAVDRRIVKSAEGAAGRRRAIDALLQEGLRQEPAAAEVAGYYQAHRQEFARPERVRVRQILTEDRASAEKALREIAAGKPFEEVARRLSKDPSASSGGYQGELSRDELPPAFAATIFALRAGEVSGLVPAGYGFHIFQVTERQPAEVVPLEAARDEIVARLRRDRADRLLGSLVQEARSRYNVKVYERNLPFGYEGPNGESQANKAG
ncbi:MAG TPA: peptidylprolyl isomerase [Thermoanaerobaculia bacterium]|nr:peptidylprolyl isomerase [Thermoanaerobaculia bacterium]